MHCCTTTSTSTLATSTAIRPRGNAAHFVRIPVISLSSLFSVVFFFWPQFCPKLALWRVLELCWVQGLSGWILGAGRAQRRNEEKRGESRRDPRRRRQAGENRGPMTQEREKRGESRRTRRNEEKRGGPAGPDPSPPRGPRGPPFNPPRGSRWLPGHTRPFCFIFGVFLLFWWKFFIFKKSACSISAAGLWNGHPALSAHRNTKVTKASSEVS